MLHYQFNNSCRPTKLYAVLNHHDPGMLSIPMQLNKFSDKALQATYGVNDKQLGTVKRASPIAIKQPAAECQKLCTGGSA